MVRREKTNYIIQSVSHALDVLEQFYGEADELGVTELSQAPEAPQEQRLPLARDPGVARLHRAEQGDRELPSGHPLPAARADLRRARWACSARRGRSWRALVKQCRESAYVAVLAPRRHGARSTPSRPIGRCAWCRRSARRCRCTAPPPARCSSPSSPRTSCKTRLPEGLKTLHRPAPSPSGRRW